MKGEHPHNALPEDMDEDDLRKVRKFIFISCVIHIKMIYLVYKIHGGLYGKDKHRD